MDVGKLPSDILAKLISKVPLDPSVIVGPKVGEDASVIEFGDKLLVAKTDPITFATDLIGWYAVHVNANDLAVSGADPKWFLASILLPENAGECLAETIFNQILEACSSLGISLVGGHTEITFALDRPIVVGCLLGETTRENLVTSGGAQVGDAVILTRGIAIEGTSILAREAEAALLKAGIPEDTIAKAKNYIVEPGISVVKAANAVRGAVRVTSMHDPTEGGLATGLREISTAAGVGLRIQEDQVTILSECSIICKALSLDPLGLIASGSLLLTCAPDDVTKALEALEVSGNQASVIGWVTPADEGLVILRHGRRTPLPIFPRDEIARFFVDKE